MHIDTCDCIYMYVFMFALFCGAVVNFDVQIYNNVR